VSSLKNAVACLKANACTIMAFILSAIVILLIILLWTLPLDGRDKGSEQKNDLFFQKLKENGLPDNQISKIFSDKRFVIQPEILRQRSNGIGYFSEKFGLFAGESISRGKKVLERRDGILQRVQNRFGVDKEILISIFRLETDLGECKYKYRVFNNLLTLAVIKNRRSDFFDKELSCFVGIYRKNNWDMLDTMGSWAGAFGLFQFMPSSYINFAIDGNQDGKIDLFNFDDAVYSAANYLALNGWRRGQRMEDNGKVIFRYNRHSDYVDAVVLYAYALSGERGVQ